jgi:hypothetical protein
MGAVTAKRAVFLAVGTAVIAALFLGWIAFFMRAEHSVYGWDFLGYWKNSAGIVGLRQHSVLRALAGIGYSARFDYNYFTLLPSALMMDLWGTSRFCYVVSNATFLVVPALILCDWLFVRFTWATWPQVAFSLLGVMTLFTIPLPWVVTLSGMSDVGGLIMAAVATDLFCRTDINSRDVTRWLAIGASLALLAMSKRWYLYLVIGLLVVFFAEVGINFLVTTLRARSLSLASIRAAIHGPFLCLGALIAVYFLAYPVPIRVVTTDYSHMYSAYQTGDSWGSAIAINMGLIVKRFGAAQLLLAGACFVAALFFPPARRPALYLGVPGVIGCLYISHVQTMDDHHTLLLFLAAAVMPLFLARQLFSSGRNGIRRWGWAVLAAALIVGLLGFQSVFFRTPPFGSSFVQSIFPATRMQPMERTDLDEISRLMHFIGDKVAATPSQKNPAQDIYLLASSYDLNSSHLQSAGFQLRQTLPAEDHVCETADVDFRNGFPDQLVTAQVVLLAEPLQTHLAVVQKDVAVPFRMFHDGTGFAQAFTRDPEIFHLDHGIQVYIFERTRASTAGEIQKLHDEIGLPSKG